MTELERALLDIAEVRDRLGMEQRFKGFSGIAAAAAGCFAIAAGLVQFVLAPIPRGTHQDHLYFALWLACCAAAAIVNYGAIAHWFISDASARDRWQTRTVGLSILPALVLGASLSFAFLNANAVGLLPGIWYGCYAVGLFASRTTLPRPVMGVAAVFFAGSVALLFTPRDIALQWWILPLGFGVGNIFIGYVLFRQRVLAR